MKKEPIVTHTAPQKRYIESLPIPGRQGDYKCAPTRKLTKFNKNKLPKKLFDSMDSVSVHMEQVSLADLCAMNCINIQRDVELHKGKLLSYLISDEVNLSTMSNISLAYVKETGEYLVLDGNTRIALCRDELLREIDEQKLRRFLIPEYFNVTVHEYETQAEAEQSYKTFDNNNAVETKKQKLQGALYSQSRTDWLSHGILGHTSYSKAMQDILSLNGYKNAGKATVFDMLEVFGDDLEHFYCNFDYSLKTHPSTRVIMAYLGLRLGYRDTPSMYPKIDKFIHAAIKYDPLKKGLHGKVGEGMFHNEFINKVIYDRRYLRNDVHVTTSPKMTFGVMLNYFNGWLSRETYTKRITDTKAKLIKETETFFQGEEE